MQSLKTYFHTSKSIPNSIELRFNQELIKIEVSKRWIHKELREFLKNFEILIKLDEELW